MRVSQARPVIEYTREKLGKQGVQFRSKLERQYKAIAGSLFPRWSGEILLHKFSD